MRLRDDQRRIVARAQHAIARHGGCLIAEDVGSGKTFVALALARSFRRPLVLVPAALRTTWREASARAAVPIALESHESLSRGRRPVSPYDVVIVDESHHFRTMSTRRHAALTALAANAPVILLSATPLQNRVRDLAAQIAVFLGERALFFDAERLSRFVIRGASAPIDAMPDVRAPEWITVRADDGATLSAILALPPPPRPLDGGDAGALRTIGLVRAWASSRAALRASIRARDRMGTAIAQGVEAGRAPTRREARAWHAAEGVVQLGFSTLLMDASPSGHALAELGVALAQECRAMDALKLVLRASPDPDVARVDALRSVRVSHPDCRIIAFSEYASTISALYSAMRGDACVGMLTAREARIATGRIPRDAMLARFAPVAQRTSPREPHQSVTLLLATDLLSEGVNLQDASIVVHLDVPWNPARLAQRVGRVRRIGGAAEVRTYVFAPPADAVSLLDADARLRRKLSSAERVVGSQFPVLPSLARVELVTTSNASHANLSASAEGELIARLVAWSAPRCPALDVACDAVAAVESAVPGWFAALSDGRLLASIDGEAPDEIPSVMRAIDLSSGIARFPSDAALCVARAAIASWLAAESLASSCGIGETPGPVRRSIERSMGIASSELPRHHRGVALPIVARLRECLRDSLPLGAERLMAAEAIHARERGALMAALERAVAAGEAARAFRALDEARQAPTVVALIVLDDAATAPLEGPIRHGTLSDRRVTAV